MADNNNSGGSSVRVTADGIAPGNLRHYWDDEFVQLLNANASAANPEPLADQLIGEISDEEIAAWSRGTPEDWVKESYGLAKDDPYMLLPLSELSTPHPLTKDYVEKATRTVHDQLMKAGIRLAAVLNEALK